MHSELVHKSLNTWYQLTIADGFTQIVLTGNYTLTALGHYLESLTDELTQQAENQDLHWDLTRIQQLDTAGTAILWRAWKGKRPEHLQLRPEHEKMFARLEHTPILRAGTRRAESQT